MSDATALSVLEVRAGGWSLGLVAARVLRVLARSEWSGAPPLSLGALLGGATPTLGERVVLLSSEAEPIALAVDEVLGVADVPRADVLPLPALVRRATPQLAALALRGGGQVLMVDIDALSARPTTPGGTS